MSKHTILSFEELKQARRPIRNANDEYRESLSRLDQLALFITEHVGTMGFFLVVFIWTIGWVGWNTLAPAAWRFDPYPAFVLWLFISNMFQILLMPLLMVGQNLQGKHSEARASADFEVNTQAEKEIGIILQQLENQNESIMKILQIVDRDRL